MYFRLVNNTFYIKRCLELAEKGKGRVAPNPMVGAVLVHNSRVIGEGWHQKYRESHAEVNCLENVSDEDKHLIPESTMYVSLEPCAHHGNTPPCAERLVKERVKKVVVCNADPFDKVSGKGFRVLDDAGVDTDKGILQEEGRWINRRFFCYNELKRPYIILKWAQTKNGFFAPLDRSRFQISNKHSAQLLHKWRTEEDAIMVGATTALHDDPELTARNWNGKNPLRIVLDKKLNLRRESKLLNNKAETWVINESRSKSVDNITYIQFDFGEGILPQLMEKLHSAKVQSLIIEGGAKLLQSFINANLWDEARVFHGEIVMNEGIVAPALANSISAFSSDLNGDVLNVYTNKDTRYPYVKELGL